MSRILLSLTLTLLVAMGSACAKSPQPETRLTPQKDRRRAICRDGRE